MKMFPILIGYRGTAGPCPSEIPWESIAPYHKMAQVNHGQTLERLSERGGLGPIEAYYVMTGQKLADLNEFPDALEREACAFLDRVSKDQLWEKLRTTERQVEDLKKCLGGFVSGLKLKDEPKAGKRWSFGYWEGVDPGLALVGDANSKSLQDTRFNAVIVYTPEEIQRLMAAVEPNDKSANRGM